MWLFRDSKPVSLEFFCNKEHFDIKIMKLCWLQAAILGGRFMQTSTWTPRKDGSIYHLAPFKKKIMTQGL